MSLTHQPRRTQDPALPDLLEDGLAAPRTILVDAFNVLHAVLLGKDRADGWWRREHRERLLERICDWQGGPDEIWVAFDGNDPSESVWAEPVAIIASAPNDNDGPAPKMAPTIHSLFVESADDWIVRRARKAEEPERVIVVSADRKVAGRARSAGVEVWTPWAFIAECTTTENAAPENATPENAALEDADVESAALEHAAPEYAAALPPDAAD